MPRSSSVQPLKISSVRMSVACTSKSGWAREQERPPSTVSLSLSVLEVCYWNVKQFLVVGSLRISRNCLAFFLVRLVVFYHYHVWLSQAILSLSFFLLLYSEVSRHMPWPHAFFPVQWKRLGVHVKQFRGSQTLCFCLTVVVTLTMNIAIQSFHRTPVIRMT